MKCRRCGENSVIWDGPVDSLDMICMWCGARNSGISCAKVSTNPDHPDCGAGRLEGVQPHRLKGYSLNRHPN